MNQEFDNIVVKLNASIKNLDVTILSGFDVSLKNCFVDNMKISKNLVCLGNQYLLNANIDNCKTDSLIVMKNLYLNDSNNIKHVMFTSSENGKKYLYVDE